jgi:hypothetical protein
MQDLQLPWPAESQSWAAGVKDAARSAAIGVETSSSTASNILQKHCEASLLFPLNESPVTFPSTIGLHRSSQRTAPAGASSLSATVSGASGQTPADFGSALQLHQLQLHDMAIYPNNKTSPSFQQFPQQSNSNQHLHSQCRPPHPQWQGLVPNITQTHHAYGTLFPSNASQFPSTQFEVSGSIPRKAQAAAGDFSSSTSACGLAHHKPHLLEQNLLVDGKRHGTCFSHELKREYCLFKMKWMSEARREPMSEARREPWRRAQFSFLKSKIQGFEGSKSLPRTLRNWWSQRHRYITEQEMAPCGEILTLQEAATCGDQVSIANPQQDQMRLRLESNAGPDHQAIRGSSSGGGRDSAGIVGIGSEDIDSACVGWNDCMGYSRGGDAEQSEAGGAAFVDASAADLDATDTAPYRKVQSVSGEPPSSVAARAADAVRAVTAAVGAVLDHAPKLLHRTSAAATAEGARALAAIAAATIEVAVSSGVWWRLSGNFF